MMNGFLFSSDRLKSRPEETPSDMHMCALSGPGVSQWGASKVTADSPMQENEHSWTVQFFFFWGIPHLNHT